MSLFQTVSCVVIWCHIFSFFFLSPQTKLSREEVTTTSYTDLVPNLNFMPKPISLIGELILMTRQINLISSNFCIYRGDGKDISYNSECDLHKLETSCETDIERYKNTLRAA